MMAMLVKTHAGLRGATPDDQKAWAKFRRRLETMATGKWLRFEWSSPRNGKHHRKMFALLQLVAENSEVYDTPKKALVAVKLAAGFFDPVVDPRTGEIVPVPQSISYDAMGQEDFEQFYGAALDGVLRVILPTMPPETADRLLDMIVEGWVAGAPDA
jgi:hypothetical protein